MIADLLLLAVGGTLLAFVNGANDVSKGIATLVGRGVSNLNDAPRIAALMLAAGGTAGAVGLTTPTALVVVTVAMLIGSAAAGRKVTTVLAHRITPMDHRDGFIANLVTSGLVMSGAVFGLPMSTTHVSTGGIIGAGSQRASPQLNRRTVRDMLLA